ncbi:MAG: metallophosphoesterase [Thermoanaerobaculia bacterium]
MKSAQILVLLLCTVMTAGALTAQGSKWEWDGVSRVVALGDVHGSYDKMVTLLEGTGMVDDQLRWIGGDQHLVFCGDLTDRGANDRSAMDLARRLQGEAEAAGGKVHVVLGNHEVMNLTRDRRYWNANLLDEFAKDETAAQRKEALRKFRAGQSTQVAGADDAFDEKFPPGYFARARALDPDGEYGSWLLELPTVVKVNGVLFLHGGLTRRVAELGLDEINAQVTTNIRDFLASADEMGDAVPFPGDMAAIMQTANARKGRAAKALLEAHEGLAFDAAGPVWYRGTSVENERLESGRVTAVLALLDAQAEMMGHTVTRTGKISTRFNGTVYRADVGMGYGRPPLAGILEGESLKVFDPAKGTITAAPAEPPQGEGWPAGEEDLADHVLEEFLQKAEIKSISTLDFDGVPVKFLNLERKDMKLRALFGAAQETAEQAAAAGRKGRRMYQHQVAAYKLDRELGLDMVPVTVLRKVDGTEGVVQIWIQGALDIKELQEYDDFSVLSGMDSQIARARAFTGLIGLHVQDRVRQGKLVLPVSRRVMLSDNGISFTVDENVEDYLPEGCGPVGPSFLHDLKTLELTKMKKDLRKLLSDTQIEAVLRRRDDLLQLCAKENPDWSVEKILGLQQNSAD